MSLENDFPPARIVALVLWDAGYWRVATSVTQTPDSAQHLHLFPLWSVAAREYIGTGKESLGPVSHGL